MKWIGIIALILIVFIYYLKTVKDSFKVDFELNDISLGNLSLSSLNQGSSFIQTRIQFLIYFSSFFNITFSDLKINAYYNGVLIAKSANNLENQKKTTLIANKQNSVFHTFDVMINSSSINMVSKIKLKQPFQINYNVSLKLFNIPITYNGIYKR